MTKYAQTGLTLLETLIAVAISGILLAAISGFVNTALNAGQATHNQNDTLQQARFAMQRMSLAVSKSRKLRIPLGENSTTAWSELAVSLDPTLDRNKDGWADANNDKDFLDVNKSGTRDTGEPERIDEDAGTDNNNDGASGIKGIDDNGDGTIDGGVANDNDEDGSTLEDKINGIDDDGDGSIDEDTDNDMNGDGKPGLSGVDDDYDGTIDEGAIDDDDEDGAVSEDWVDEQVFYLSDPTPPLSGTTLLERLPNINAVNGADYTEYSIAENVSQFSVERVLGVNGSTVLVDITLRLSPPVGDPVSLNTRVAVGGGL